MAFCSPWSSAGAAKVTSSSRATDATPLRNCSAGQRSPQSSARAHDDQAYILTLVENLQREDLSPREEAAALEVLVRERGWSTRQVGEAVKRSAMYVSRRLRVFDDPVLAPFVLRGDLAVSTAEELLRADPEQRSELASQAATEGWERPQVRAALAERNAALRQPSPRLASHIRALTAELSVIEPGSLSTRVKRDLARLLDVGQMLT
jgi:ParB-like chromosome segregation protein Spo0J